MTTTDTTSADIARLHQELLDRGYRDLDEIGGLRVGARVRNGGERYSEALRVGTGLVRVLVEKDPSPWAREWGRRDVELVVERDREVFGSRVGRWADYHTALVTSCYWCDGPVAADGTCECPPEQQERARRRR